MKNENIKNLNKRLGEIDYARLMSIGTTENFPEEDRRRSGLSIAEQVLAQAKNEPEISDHELIEACIKTDKDLNPAPKTIINALLYRYTGDIEQFLNGKALNDADYSKEAVRTFKSPLLDIKLKGEFVQIDFIFKSGTDPELRIMWSQLEMFGNLQHYFYSGKINAFPIFALNIMPKKYIGRCYLSVFNPYYWTLEPENPGVSINNVIRMIVKSDNLIVTPDVLNDIDICQIDADVRREMERSGNL